ncbi:hypothetical protein KQI84_04495 [bacterium]|nr:hypothetical protein [bacterium]
MRTIATRLFLCLSLLLPCFAAAQLAARIQPLGVPQNEPAAEFYARQLGAGENVQALIQPGEGKLLDPVSIQATWNGDLLPTMVYYPTPAFALMFVHPTDPLTTQTGTLVFAGKTLDGESFSAGDELDVPGTEPTDRMAEGFPRVRVLDRESQLPIAQARVFGQRIRDLFTLTNRAGIALLDAPKRSTPDPHWAWGPGHVAQPFDPRTSPTISLVAMPQGLDAPWLPAELPEGIDAVSVRISTAGELPGQLLAWVGRTWWVRPSDAGEFQIPIIPDYDQFEVIVLSPGYAPGVAHIGPKDKEAPPVEIRLERR